MRVRDQGPLGDNDARVSPVLSRQVPAVAQRGTLREAAAWTLSVGTKGDSFSFEVFCIFQIFPEEHAHLH